MKIYTYKYLPGDHEGCRIFEDLKLSDETHEGFFIKDHNGKIKRKFFKKKWYIQNMHTFKTNQKINDKRYKLMGVEEI